MERDRFISWERKYFNEKEEDQDIRMRGENSGNVNSNVLWGERDRSGWFWKKREHSNISGQTQV